MNVFRNPYIVDEIKVIVGCKKSNIEVKVVPQQA